jgi:hypothetical protein
MTHPRKKSGQNKAAKSSKDPSQDPKTKPAVNMATGVSATETFNLAFSQTNDVLQDNTGPFNANYVAFNPAAVPPSQLYNSNSNRTQTQPYHHDNSNGAQGVSAMPTSSSTSHMQQNAYHNPPHYPGQGPNIALMLQQMNSQLNSRFTNIEHSLSKLTTMETNISHLRSDVATLKSENTQLSDKLNEFEKFCQTTSNVCDDFVAYRKSNEIAMGSFSKQINSLTADNSVLKQESRDLNGKILEIQSRSMENNLLFFGLGEGAPTRHRNDAPEDTVAMLRDFLITELKLENGASIEFDRVHRLGKRRFDRAGRQLRPRPIVAKFTKWSDREDVRLASVNLRDSKFSIREQYPLEIEERRRSLYPIMKNAKADGQNAWLVRDKLFINGSEYTAESHMSDNSSNRYDTRAEGRYGQSNYERDGTRNKNNSNRYTPSVNSDRRTWRSDDQDRGRDTQFTFPSRNADSRNVNTPTRYNRRRDESSLSNSNRFAAMHDGDLMESDLALDRNVNNRKNKASSPLNDQLHKKSRDEIDVLTKVTVGDLVNGTCSNTDGARAPETNAISVVNGTCTDRVLAPVTQAISSAQRDQSDNPDMTVDGRAVNGTCADHESHSIK